MCTIQKLPGVQQNWAFLAVETQSFAYNWVKKIINREEWNIEANMKGNYLFFIRSIKIIT